MLRTAAILTSLFVVLIAQSASAVQIKSSIVPNVTSGPKKAVPLSEAKPARVDVAIKIHGRSEEATLEDVMTVASLRIKMPFKLNAAKLDVCQRKSVVLSGCDDTALVAKTSSLQIIAPGNLDAPVNGTLYIYYGGPGKLITLLQVDRWRIPSQGTYKTSKSSTSANIDLSLLFTWVRTALSDKNGVVSLKPGLTIDINAIAEFGLNDSLAITSCPGKWSFFAELARLNGTGIEPNYRKKVSCRATTS